MMAWVGGKRENVLPASIDNEHGKQLEALPLHWDIAGMVTRGGT